MTNRLTSFVHPSDPTKLLDVSNANGLPVTMADGMAVDGMGRLRVSEPFGIYDNKNVLSKNDNQFYETADGTGSIAHQSNESTVLLTSGTVAGNVTRRQTARYFSYVPGKSQSVELTYVLGSADANIAKRVGYFDDRNGLYIERLSNADNLCIRSYTSGSVVEVKKPQAEWNVDKLDGTGESGVNIDLSKSQVMRIDFIWYGSGRVRFSFNVGGVWIVAHEFKDHANVLSVPYIGTPSLPVRYEIEVLSNVGVASTMKEDCFAVSSEGGYVPPGVEFQEGHTWAQERAITTRTPIFAVRLLNTFNGGLNRRTLKYINSRFFTRTNDCLFEVHHVHIPSAITATWTAVGGGSAAEYSTDITTVTGNPSHRIDGVPLAAGQGSSGGNASVESLVINKHSFASQNEGSTNSEMFVVYATSQTGIANVISSLTWIEFD